MLTFINFIVQGLTGIFAYIITSITKKALVTVAIIAALGSIIFWLTTQVNDAIESLVVQRPGGLFHQAFGLLPPNLPSALTVIWSCHLLSLIYKVKVMVLSVTNYQGIGSGRF
jgi:hypothetical protein